MGSNFVCEQYHTSGGYAACLYAPWGWVTLDKCRSHTPTLLVQPLSFDVPVLWNMAKQAIKLNFFYSSPSPQARCTSSEWWWARYLGLWWHLELARWVSRTHMAVVLVLNGLGEKNLPVLGPDYTRGVNSRKCAVGLMLVEGWSFGEGTGLGFRLIIPGSIGVQFLALPQTPFVTVGKQLHLCVHGDDDVSLSCRGLVRIQSLKLKRCSDTTGMEDMLDCPV